MVNAENSPKLYARMLHGKLHTKLHTVGTARRASLGES